MSEHKLTKASEGDNKVRDSNKEVTVESTINDTSSFRCRFSLTA